RVSAYADGRHSRTSASEAGLRSSVGRRPKPGICCTKSFARRFAVQTIEALGRTSLAGEANDELAHVLAAEQHSEANGRALQSIKYMQSLVKAAIAPPGGEPGACFIVMLVVVEY
ncbi:MAG: hypothetical protein ABIH03_14480, partial [Pseudomonadota bacterium]